MIVGARFKQKCHPPHTHTHTLLYDIPAPGHQEANAEEQARPLCRGRMAVPAFFISDKMNDRWTNVCNTKRVEGGDGTKKPTWLLRPDAETCIAVGFCFLCLFLILRGLQVPVKVKGREKDVRAEGRPPRGPLPHESHPLQKRARAP